MALSGSALASLGLPLSLFPDLSDTFSSMLSKVSFGVNVIGSILLPRDIIAIDVASFI
jgi:hypothetical protein